MRSFRVRHLSLSLPLLCVLVLGSFAQRDCDGTENKLSLLGSVEKQYNTLVTTYANCEIVMGNLEITYIRNGSDLSFLKTIREVSGYVLIALNEVDYIPLDNLQLIRGMELYDEHFALTVLLNYNKTNPEQKLGLRELRLSSLTEILRGAVQIKGNDFLCHVDTIDWGDMLNPNNKENFSNELDFIKNPMCPPCHKDCSKHKSCWGSSSPDHCQKFTLSICAKQCDGRCHGPDANQCCHQHCASGCRGPLDTNCFACRVFNDSGACVERCPLPVFYKPSHFQLEANPDVKYSYGSRCVKECPKNFVVDYNSCVRSCPDNKTEAADENGVKQCKPCQEDICPKVCDGIGFGDLIEDETVNSQNIHLFANCTTISGNLIFLQTGILGDRYYNISRLEPSKLQVFHTVKEITGFLNIEAWPQNMTDLRVLENVMTIRGRDNRNDYSFLISNIGHLKAFKLQSLQEISEGSVYIKRNPNLCYQTTVNWTRILRSPQQKVFSDPPNKTCATQGHVCHQLCSDEGCWGEGPDQCLSCKAFRRLRTCVEACHLYEGEPREFENGSSCVPCHSECLQFNNTLTCFGQGSMNCSQCRHYKEGPHCVEECPEGMPGARGELIYKYPDHNNVCQPCHPNCTQRCYGPTLNDCKDLSYLQSNRMSMVVASIVSALFAMFALILTLFMARKHKRRQRKRTLQKYVEDELVQPLSPSGASPNQAQLRVLKETELKKGKVLGTGAFGTVYKGIWLPEGRTVKIAVAIKVLKEAASPKANKEIMDEAYVMATIDHPHLVRLLGICLTSPVQLVTQLMPHGCLLNYVRVNHDAIGSQLLLNWCVQIAKGMLYLEERRLVHRDLAARNVLVKAPNHVKITDFGLARLLDIHEQEYLAEGGKLPIKWMSLESIQFRKFTHQSDIWSYGVTVWELMTFGGKPYDGIAARDIPDLLEKGERLPQPPICTIDVYMIMVKCWMIDADARPKFSELAADFSKMARDPFRYLVIKGDQPVDLPSPSEGKMFKNVLDSVDVGSLSDSEEFGAPRPFILMPPPSSRRGTGNTGNHSPPPPYTPMRGATTQGLVSTLPPVTNPWVQRRTPHRQHSGNLGVTSLPGGLSQFSKFSPVSWASGTGMRYTRDPTMPLELDSPDSPDGDCYVLPISSKGDSNQLINGNLGPPRPSHLTLEGPEYESLMAASTPSPSPEWKYNNTTLPAENGSSFYKQDENSYRWKTSDIHTAVPVPEPNQERVEGPAEGHYLVPRAPRTKEVYQVQDFGESGNMEEGGVDEEDVNVKVYEEEEDEGVYLTPQRPTSLESGSEEAREQQYMEMEVAGKVGRRVWPMEATRPTADENGNRFEAPSSDEALDEELNEKVTGWEATLQAGLPNQQMQLKGHGIFPGREKVIRLTSLV
uniref:receptor protein-tyrosine kinase n=2 Tax=Eptatretus burgeri TaxID=7764 RepID=A0A8C4QW65_EPTBU